MHTLQHFAEIKWRQGGPNIVFDHGETLPPGNTTAIERALFDAWLETLLHYFALQRRIY
jgi:hypothetical protein